MNKFTKAILTFLIILFPLFLAKAEDSDTTLVSDEANSQKMVLDYVRHSSEPGKVVSLDQNETIDHDFFAAGESVEVYGTVNGDAYIAGGRVLVDGDINGDLLVAGGQVTVDGSVSDDVRVFGGTVFISGDVGKNVTIGAGNVTITNSGRIGGSIVAGAGNLEIASEVGGNVVAGTGNSVLSGSISGDYDGASGTLRLTPQSRVGGNIHLWGETEPDISESAFVGGETSFTKTQRNLESRAEKTPENVQGGFDQAFLGLKSILTAVGFISAVILGLILQKLAPAFFLNSNKKIKENIWSTLGIGFMYMILVPAIIFVLLITVVGVPIALILGAKYLITLYLAKLFVAFFVGSWIFQKLQSKDRRGWAMVLGIFLYYVLDFIPVFGWFIGLLVKLVGLGAIWLTCKELYMSAKEKKLI